MYGNFDFYSISKLFTVEVRQRWKQLKSRVAETTASFLLGGSFRIYNFSHYSSIPTISCFRHQMLEKRNATKRIVVTINLQQYNGQLKLQLWRWFAHVGPLNSAKQPTYGKLQCCQD
jgi:hypothetical protein